jgi:ubiquinone/menaquinone biosynthesis C-methylase UbiE
MQQLITRLGKRLFRKDHFQEFDAESAYDQWASDYDQQPENLMLALDEQLADRLLSHTPQQIDTILDVGCGTGRHWPKLMRYNGTLMGTDVSEGMLLKLKSKFPGATVFHTPDGTLPELPVESVDLLISTLTIAHIQDVAGAIDQWSKLVCRGGHVLLTDYHPTALERGARRTFQRDGKTISIVNYVHPLPRLVHLFAKHGISVVRQEEEVVGESMRSFYERQQALALYERWKGTPIIYGLLLKKDDATH